MEAYDEKKNFGSKSGGMIMFDDQLCANTRYSHRGEPGTKCPNDADRSGRYRDNRSFGFHRGK